MHGIISGLIVNGLKSDPFIGSQLMAGIGLILWSDSTLYSSRPKTGFEVMNFDLRLILTLIFHSKFKELVSVSNFYGNRT